MFKKPNLARDEKVVVELISQFEDKKDLLHAIEEHFLKCYSRHEHIHLTYSEDTGDWTISTRHGERTVSMPESLPSALHSIL